jgi:hypothetical protein
MQRPERPPTEHARHVDSAFEAHGRLRGERSGASRMDHGLWRCQAMPNVRVQQPSWPARWSMLRTPRQARPRWQLLYLSSWNTPVLQATYVTSIAPRLALAEGLCNERRRTWIQERMNCDSAGVCGLTLELSGPQRHGAWPVRRTINQGVARAKRHAVAGPLERRVMPRS